MLKDLLKAGDWMARVDLKDAYFMIPMGQEDRDFLKFQWKDKTYQFTCLPFGLSSAPWVFTKTTRPVVATLRELGLHLVIYIDDILIMAETESLLKDHIIAVIYLLENLGFVINHPKSVLTPTQEIEFLGFTVNSTKMELKLPGEKIKKIRAETGKVLQSPTVSALALSRIIGKMNAATQAIPMAPLYYRGLQACLREALQGNQNYASVVTLTNEAREELEWWRDHFTQWNGRSLIAHNTSLTIETDASKRGWGSMQRDPHRGPMEPTGTSYAYQLPGAFSSTDRYKMLCQKQFQSDNPSEDGQCVSLDIHQQARGDDIPRAESPSQRALVVVHGEKHPPRGTTPTWGLEYNSRQRVKSHEGPLGLDALPQGVPTDQPETGTPGSGSVCQSTDLPTTTVCQLETGPTSHNNRRIHNKLGGFQGVCKPSLESNRKSAGSDSPATSRACPSGSSMESTGMVPCATEHVNTHTTPDPSERGSDPSHTPREPPRGNPNSSRVGYLRQRYKECQISEGASKLLLASWRQKSSKTYDSLFGKWISWCSGRDCDPVSCPIGEVVNFLAHLFEHGYQYRSINSYRSAISSVHEKVDGCEVGQHPLVARILKGIFHERPPQPRYSEAWNVDTVTTYIESLGENDSLSLATLTHKTVMILALT